MQTGSSLSGGVAILILGPSFLVAVASAKLLCKKNFSFGPDITEDEPNQTNGIDIELGNGKNSETVELLNPDFLEKSKLHTPIIEDKECIATFEPFELAADTDSTVNRAERLNSIDNYYGPIANHVNNLPKNKKIVLLAANNISELPVTVAVNTAIRILKQNSSCLLVDTDNNRNALSRVFEIEPDKIQQNPIKTCIDGLSVHTITNLSENLKTLVEFSNEYDRIIIYAPNLNSSHIVKDVGINAIAFPDEGGEAQLVKFLQNSNYHLLAVIGQLDNK